MSVAGFRPRLTAGAIVIAVVGLMGRTEPNAAESPFPLWGDLQPGPFAVGYRHIVTVDNSRTWSGASVDAVSGRPLRVGIWYPTDRPTSSPVRFREYVVEMTAAPPGPPLEPEQLLTNYEAAAFPDRTRADVDVLFDTLTAAHREAPAALPGAPLVVFAPGLGATPLTHTVTLEFLASHGFVVASTPAVGSSDLPMTYDADGQEAQTRDVEFVLGLLRSQFGGTRAALVGFSFGSNAALLASLRRGDVASVASIDGSIGFLNGTPTLRASGDYEPLAFTRPLLHLNISSYSFNDPTVIDELVLSTRTLVSFRVGGHEDFIARGLIGARAGRVLPAASRLVYQMTAHAVLAFLRATLRDETSGLETLQAQLGSSATVLTRPGRPALPSPAVLVRLAWGGDLEALGRQVRAMRSREPGVVPFSAAAMARAAEQLRSTGRAAEARSLLTYVTQVLPNDDRAWTELAEDYEAAGLWRDAARAYRRALSVNPQNRLARRGLTEVMRRR